jgi:hypothetical protein
VKLRIDVSYARSFELDFLLHERYDVSKTKWILRKSLRRNVRRERQFGGERI